MSRKERKYEDQDTKSLIKSHDALFRSLCDYRGNVNLIARDKLNILLEIDRELTIREVCPNE